MDDYVPPEERERQRLAAAERQRAARATAQRHAATRAAAALMALDGNHTNAYVEVLRPIRGPRLLNRGRTIVRRHGAPGGPNFVISEVVQVYRISEAIVEEIPKSESGRSWTFDAFVAPDGRTWQFAGRGESWNTWQLLEGNAVPLEDRGTADLERIAAALERLPV